MGRPKKNDSEALVSVVDDYYSNVAKGDARRLKYSNLAKHAEKMGLQAAWYDFQRDAAVLQRIAELRDLGENEAGASAVPAYKNLDIEALLNHCGTVDELKERLLELDQYWKKIYDGAVKTSAQDRELSGQIQNMEREKAESSQKLSDADSRMKALERENAYLRRMIRDNLYPAVADELLKGSNLPVAENKTVMPEALSHLIEGNTPQPLETAQQPQHKKLTRQEQLVEDMRKQVKKHGQQ